MPNYRRAWMKGGCYFFTVNLLDRRRRLLVEHIDALRSAVRETSLRYPFRIDAWVVLPDHMHAVWTLPTGDADFSVRWAAIKRRFSLGIPGTEPRGAARRRRGERGIWQRRFWEHLIRDEADFRRHVEYCYFNPVRHGYVARVGDWAFSSFHRDVQAGLFPRDWAGAVELEHCAGERD